MSSFYLQTKETIAFHSSKWMKCEANLRTYRSWSKIENVILLPNTKLKTKFQNFALDTTCMGYWSQMKPYTATMIRKNNGILSIHFKAALRSQLFSNKPQKPPHLNPWATSPSTFSEVEYIMSQETCTSFLWWSITI